MHKTIKLIPPKLSEEHIKEKITCIRAHRERIFQINYESYEDKIIFNNYGQGGAGWTFLFGSVNKSINLFLEQILINPNLKSQDIIVIGAGCYGLLTAILLSQKGYKVKIIAKDTKDIPSYKAAGFFFPRPRKMSTPEEKDTFLKLGLDSYKNYKKIAENKHSFILKGVKFVPAYYCLDIDPGFGPYIEDGLVDSPEIVTIDFGIKKYFAYEYNIAFINSELIMEEFHRLVKEYNIEIINKQISSFSDISENIIFNCSGWGSKLLVQDKRLVPVQGHLISLKNQDIDNMQYMINFKVTVKLPDGRNRDELIYFAPKGEGILGITFIRGQDSLDANYHEFERILDRSRDFFR